MEEEDEDGWCKNCCFMMSEATVSSEEEKGSILFFLSEFKKMAYVDSGKRWVEGDEGGGSAGGRLRVVGDSSWRAIACWWW
ncbi:hypothetical protein HAX54_034141 [Datura stramonium]|uniref:Uncharacterized protein n=1 Tax=Datura stramonium TaxID=4076 RepID=A0ABS8VDG3_DATST|nr:hypothetical protein [Datura stramonium]